MNTTLKKSDGPDEAESLAKLDQLIDHLSMAVKRREEDGQPGSEELQDALAMARDARDGCINRRKPKMPLKQVLELITAGLKLIGEFFNIVSYSPPHPLLRRVLLLSHAARPSHQGAARSAWRLAAGVGSGPRGLAAVPVVC